jgi:hypothetical protein
VAAPESTRSHVTSPGSKAFNPIAISRNEEPQITPIEANRNHSVGPKAPRCVPSLVDRTLATPRV